MRVGRSCGFCWPRTTPSIGCWPCGCIEKRGHGVTVANNGREALEALQKDHFDVVLMDVQMPEVDGFEATALIRAREHGTGRHVAIVAMTAYAMKGDRERCLAAQMDGYVAKPIKAEELFKEIEQVLCPAPSPPAQPYSILDKPGEVCSDGAAGAITPTSGQETSAGKLSRSGDNGVAAIRRGCR